MIIKSAVLSAEQDAGRGRWKAKGQVDSPGHCMHCDGALPGRGDSGYCSFKCQSAEERHK